MAYITNYNFNRITTGFEVPKDKNFKFEDIVIWVAPSGVTIDKDNPTCLFAKWDVEELLIFKAFCKDAKLAKGTFYHKIPKPVDSYRYVQPEKSPAYHENPECERLHAEFERITIPEEIRKQGKEKVIEFRQWWKEHEHLRLTKPDAFVFRLNLNFHTNVKTFEVETKNNSGIKCFENVTVREIDNEIYKKFFELYTWAKEDEKRLEIFNEYAYLSYLCRDPNNPKPLKFKDVSFSESDIIDVLKYVHPKKKEIIQSLKNLYVKTYNPNLEFDQTLLDELGFEPCGSCCVKWIAEL